MFSKEQRLYFKKIPIVAFLMFLFILIFKYFPMFLFGNDILFDASLHITITIFILYLIYLLIYRKKEFRFPYFLMCFSILLAVSVQRISVGAHSIIGISLGILISLTSIILANWKYVK